MFEDQYVELLPARTTMKAWSRRRRSSVVNIGGDGGNGGNGGAGGLGVNINVNPQVAVFGGENSSTVTQNAGNGGAGGAGGAGGSAG